MGRLAPDTHIINRYPRILWVIGVGFLAWGILILLHLKTAWSTNHQNLPSTSLTCAAFILIALGALGGRHYITIDFFVRQVSTTRGWLFWAVTTTHNIGAWSGVQAGPAERRIERSRSPSHVAFPVVINGTAGSCEIAAPMEPPAARRLAELLAGRSQLPWVDATSDTVIKHPGAGASAEAAIVSAQVDIPQSPAIPDHTLIRVEDTATGIVVHIPPPPRRGRRLCWALSKALIPILALFAPWYYFLLPVAHVLSPLPFSIIFVAIPLAALLIRAVMTVRTRDFSRTVVMVSKSTGIQVRSSHIATADLHDLRIIDNGAVAALQVRSPHQVIHLGKGQSREDLVYIRDSIRRTVGQKISSL